MQKGPGTFCIMKIELEQIPVLVEHFVQKQCDELGLPTKKVTPQMMKLLQNHSWSGDAQELQEVIKRAIVRAPREMILGDIELKKPEPKESVDINRISLEKIVREKLESFFSKWQGYEMTDLHEMVLQQIEKPLIELTLQRTKGNQIRAAKILGINRNTLHKKIKQLEIRKNFQFFLKMLFQKGWRV